MYGTNVRVSRSPQASHGQTLQKLPSETDRILMGWHHEGSAFDGKLWKRESRVVGTVKCICFFLIGSQQTLVGKVLRNNVCTTKVISN